MHDLGTELTLLYGHQDVCYEIFLSAADMSNSNTVFSPARHRELSEVLLIIASHLQSCISLNPIYGHACEHELFLVLFVIASPL